MNTYKTPKLPGLGREPSHLWAKTYHFQLPLLAGNRAIQAGEKRMAKIPAKKIRRDPNLAALKLAYATLEIKGESK